VIQHPAKLKFDVFVSFSLSASPSASCPSVPNFVVPVDFCLPKSDRHDFPTYQAGNLLRGIIALRKPVKLHLHVASPILRSSRSRCASRAGPCPVPILVQTNAGVAGGPPAFLFLRQLASRLPSLSRHGYTRTTVGAAAYHIPPGAPGSAGARPRAGSRSSPGAAPRRHA